MIDLKTNYFNWIPPDFPKVVLVEPGQGDEVTFRGKFEERLPHPFTVRAMDLFFGHDRGDCFEMDVTIYGDDRFLGRRVEEGHSMEAHEATRVIELPVPERVMHLAIYVTCRVTGASKVENSAHPSYNKWRGNFDLNIIFLGAQ